MANVHSYQDQVHRFYNLLLHLVQSRINFIPELPMT